MGESIFKRAAFALACGSLYLSGAFMSAFAQPSASAGQETTVYIDSIDLLDNSALASEDLEEIYAGYIGRPLTFTEIVQIAEDLEAAYHQRGYLLARVVIPPQQIENGVLVLHAYEGRVERKAITTDNDTARKQIASFLEPLELGSPVRQEEAERALLLAKTIPGITASPSVTAGGQPGAVILTVEAERKPVSGSLVWQNKNAPEVGRGSLSARLSLAGRSVLGDQLSLGVFASDDFEEQLGVNAGYTRRLSAKGLTGFGQVTYSDSTPGGPISSLDFASEALIGKAGLSYPLVLKSETQLYAGIDMEAVEISSDVFGGTGIYEDSIRQLNLTLALRHLLPERKAGATIGVSLDAAYSQGLDAFGASEKGDLLLSRPFGDPAAGFVKLEGNLKASWNRTGWEARVAAAAQYADKPLLSYNEYSFGNYTIGRGYDPGAYAADRAIGVSVEVSAPDILQKVENDPISVVSLRPVVFADAIAGQTLDPGTENYTTLASYGAGFRADIDNKLTVEAIWAKPVRDLPSINDRPSSRFLVTVSTDFDRISSMFGG